MRQTTVLNAEPSVKIGDVKTSQGTIKALILCFFDHDANEIIEYPLIPPIAKAVHGAMGAAIKDLPELPPDLVIPNGPISEEDLARAAAMASGKPPPGS